MDTQGDIPRVLHLPVEIAGQLAAQVEGLRAIGVPADSLCARHPFAYAHQPTLAFPSRPRGWSHLAKAWRALQVAGRYDVYHYHFASSLLPKPLRFPDARLNRRLGRRVIVEFWGSDVRKPSIETARNPWYVNSYDEDDARADAVMHAWAGITGGHALLPDHTFVAAAAPHFRHLHFVPQAIRCDRFSPHYPEAENDCPRVVHIPSQQAFKGTELVRAAVQRLQARGLRFEYREVSGVSHAEAMRACREADLVVDQMRAGSHGVFAIEAMALGKPVLCYILPELFATYPEGFPLVNANPDTLDAVLAEWIGAPGARRRARGIESRRYAERVHDAPVVARQLLDVYRRLPGSGR